MSQNQSDVEDLRVITEEGAGESLHPERVLSLEQVERVLQELRAHQIELEAQNEELRRSQRELEASRERYFHLFELAPIGYLTLDHEGYILEANLKASKLFGVEVGRLVRRPLSRFIPLPQESVFRNHCQELEETGAMQVFELRMHTAAGHQFWARVQIIAGKESDGISVFRVTISDISDRKRAENALKDAYNVVEQTVDLRTRELQNTIAELVRTRGERERLQHELLKISERDKQLIAQELHDGLCQHLTGTAMMGSVVARRLAQRGDPEAEQASKICELLNRGVDEARSLSHGLHPVKPESEGLMEALLVYATTTSRLFHVECTFRCLQSVKIELQSVATHLFRIAQEAVTNALRHGKATQVIISLKRGYSGNGTTLSIRDNGTGMPPGGAPETSGMGLRIMHYRAEVMGADLKVTPRAQGGTTVKCIWPG